MITSPPNPMFRQTSDKAAGLLTFAALALITVFSEIYWYDTFGLKQYLDASRSNAIDGLQLWRLFTSNFVHADKEHFIHNIVPMGLFGFALAKNYGWMAFPVIPFLMASVFTALVLLTFIVDTNCIGASGIVYFMGAFWLTLFCSTRRDLSVSVRALVCGAAIFYYVAIPPVDPIVNHRAHIIGAIFGFTSAAFFFARRKKKFLNVGSR